MKNTILILSILSAAALWSSRTFAAPKDVDAFDALIASGVEPDGGMSKIHVGASNVACFRETATGAYECHLFDLNAPTQESAQKNLSGAEAKALFDALKAAGAPGEECSEGIALAVGSIVCRQVNAGAYDEEVPASERTSCRIDLEIGE